jgi:hypothetical protein
MELSWLASSGKMLMHRRLSLMAKLLYGIVSCKKLLLLEKINK